MYTWPPLQLSFLRSAGAGTPERRACLVRRVPSEHAATPAQGGFTIIEMVIGVLIIALLTTLGIPTYNAWIRNSQIRNGAEAVSSGIQLARAQAIRCNLPVQFVLTASATPASWVVSQVTGTSCAPASAGLPAGTFQNWTAAEGAATTVFTPTAGATTVSFNGLGRVVANADASGSLLQVDVSSSASSAAEIRQLRITVGAGGGVRMCDPATNLPAGDPRAC